MRQSWETMTSVSAGHIILTPTQPVGSGRPQRGGGGDRTRDLLTRSRALYRLSYRAPQENFREEMKGAAPGVVFSGGGGGGGGKRRYVSHGK